MNRKIFSCLFLFPTEYIYLLQLQNWAICHVGFLKSFQVISCMIDFLIRSRYVDVWISCLTIGMIKLTLICTTWLLIDIRIMLLIGCFIVREFKRVILWWEKLENCWQAEDCVVILWTALVGPAGPAWCPSAAERQQSVQSCEVVWSKACEQGWPGRAQVTHAGTWHTGRSLSQWQNLEDSVRPGSLMWTQHSTLHLCSLSLHHKSWHVLWITLICEGSVCIHSVITSPIVSGVLH